MTHWKRSCEPPSPGWAEDSAKRRPRGFLLNKTTWMSSSAWSADHFIYFFSLFLHIRTIYKYICNWKKSGCIYRSKWRRNFNAYEQVPLPWNHWHKIKAFMIWIAVPVHRTGRSGGAQLCAPVHTSRLLWIIARFRRTEGHKSLFKTYYITYT